MALSSVTCAAAAAISAWTCALSAFIFGRSSRIVAIWSATSTRTNSPTQSTSTPRTTRVTAAPIDAAVPQTGLPSCPGRAGGPDTIAVFAIRPARADIGEYGGSSPRGNRPRG